jgi:hypothetical protein
VESPPRRATVGWAPQFYRQALDHHTANVHVSGVCDQSEGQCDFLFPDDSEGGLPLLHKWLHHMLLAPLSITPFVLM